MTILGKAQESLQTTVNPISSTAYQKAKQMLNRKETKIIGTAAVVLAGLVLTYLNRGKIAIEKPILFPNADEQCIQQLNQDSSGKNIADIFGGIRGFCSLPKLERDELTVIQDPNEMNSPIMRIVYRNQNHLAIKTELICNKQLNPDPSRLIGDCPNGLVGVEHLVWGQKLGYGEGVYHSVAQHGLAFCHLEKTFNETKRILSDLHDKGSSEISLKNYIIRPFMPIYSRFFIPENGSYLPMLGQLPEQYTLKLYKGSICQ